MSKIALITGATSGIGLSYSKLLASHGWDLIITGRRAEILNQSAKDLMEQYKCRVEVVILDFFEKDNFQTFINDVVKKREISFLVNNVGYSNHNDFFSSDFYSNHKMIDVHISKMVEITHFAVEGMVSRGYGSIVNVSSLAGFLPSLSDPFYSGSKSFINTYSESIALILKEHNIKVQSLCPGFTKTDFHKKMNLNDKAFKNRGLKRWMEADDVVKYSFSKLKGSKVIVIPGLCNKIVYNITRSIPKRLYYYLAGRKRALNEK